MFNDATKCDLSVGLCLMTPQNVISLWVLFNDATKCDLSIGLCLMTSQNTFLFKINEKLADYWKPTPRFLTLIKIKQIYPTH